MINIINIAISILLLFLIIFFAFKMNKTTNIVNKNENENNLNKQKKCESNPDYCLFEDRLVQCGTNENQPCDCYGNIINKCGVCSDENCPCPDENNMCCTDENNNCIKCGTEPFEPCGCMGATWDCKGEQGGSCEIDPENHIHDYKLCGNNINNCIAKTSIRKNIEQNNSCECSAECNSQTTGGCCSLNNKCTWICSGGFLP